MGKKIFISYARNDTNIMTKLSATLKNTGHDPWTDTELPIGQPWKTVLENQIAACDCFMFILTQHWLESNYCQWEFYQAVKHRKPLIPVLMETIGELPSVYADLQYVDCTHGNCREKVLAALEKPQLIPLRLHEPRVSDERPHRGSAKKVYRQKANKVHTQVGKNEGTIIQQIGLGWVAGIVIVAFLAIAFIVYLALNARNTDSDSESPQATESRAVSQLSSDLSLTPTGTTPPLSDEDTYATATEDERRIQAWVNETFTKIAQEGRVAQTVNAVNSTATETPEPGETLEFVSPTPTSTVGVRQTVVAHVTATHQTAMAALPTQPVAPNVSSRPTDRPNNENPPRTPTTTPTLPLLPSETATTSPTPTITPTPTNSFTPVNTPPPTALYTDNHIRYGILFHPAYEPVPIFDSFDGERILEGKNGEVVQLWGEVPDWYFVGFGWVETKYVVFSLEADLTAIPITQTVIAVYTPVPTNTPDVEGAVVSPVHSPTPNIQTRVVGTQTAAALTPSRTPTLAPSRSSTPTSTPRPTTIAPQPSPTNTPDGITYYSPARYGVITTSAANAVVRESPTFDAPVVVAITRGSIVSVSGTKNDWYLLSSGWIHNSVIFVSSNYNAVAATATSMAIVQIPPTNTSVPVITGPTNTPAPNNTAQPSAIFFEIASVGVYGETWDNQGCDAQIRVTVVGDQPIGVNVWVWNASYGGDGTTTGDQYPYTEFAPGIAYYQITLGGNQDYRDHRIRLETNGYGTVGPTGNVRCRDE